MEDGISQTEKGERSIKTRLRIDFQRWQPPYFEHAKAYVVGSNVDAVTEGGDHILESRTSRVAARKLK
jgi:hypothetical protein